MASPPPPLSNKSRFRVSLCPYLLLLVLFFPSSASSSKISYADHCTAAAAAVPQSDASVDKFSTFTLSTGYFSGADSLFGPDAGFSVPFPRSFSFLPRSIHWTQTPGVLKIAGTLFLRGGGGAFWTTHRNLTENRSLLHRVRPRIPHSFSRRAKATFELDGFWSESSGFLCMVGNGVGRSKQGSSVDLAAVFKLNYKKNFELSTSFISGSLMSLDAPGSSNHFDKISVLAYAEGNYEYTQIARAESSCSRVGGLEESRGFGSSFSCSRLQSVLEGGFRLEGGKNCSDGHCVPARGSLGFNQHFMSLNQVHCTDDGKIHMYVVFSNWTSFQYHSFVVAKNALVGEGVWDKENSRLCLVACNVLISKDTPVNLSVGNCPFGMSFWLPAVWSIRSRSIAVGRIWSEPRKGGPDNFSMLSFQSTGRNRDDLSGLKYNYTKMDVVRMSCVMDDLHNKRKERYPDGSSFVDLKFGFSVTNAEGKSARGYAAPVTIGDVFSSGSFMSDRVLPFSKPTSTEMSHSLLNVSYKISYTSPAASLNLNEETEILAEGIYNTRTGSLCLVGCRPVDFLDVAKQAEVNDSMDCQVLINVQFAPLNGKTREHLRGAIRSTRDRSDPLFLDPLEITSYGIYTAQAAASIWRMDLEITMVLISLTLSCIFIGLQLFHVKKNPEIIPSISVTMLVILSLGYMIPLVLNFEALFFIGRSRQNVLSWTGGWLEVNEVLVRVMTMVAFLLQFRLLQIAWTARSVDEGKRAMWVTEKKALFICAPLYVVGGLIALLIHMKSNQAAQQRPYLVSVHRHTLWEDLISYAGLILDGFLLPQVIFNVFSDSKDKVLAPSFYVGSSLVRALPHVYDAYRAQSYIPGVKSSYIYASPHDDFFTLAWDIIIPFGGLLLSVIICLQQSLGGACFLLLKHKKSIEYEMVPVASS
ncbi:uncharacterized protein [Typha latifolia]|uniref:uncharacterized protein n=1 Tax=Typha latifolia TaxID=4733 RepID=UPI003C2B9682